MRAVAPAPNGVHVSERLVIANAIPIEDEMVARMRAVSPRIDVVPLTYRPPRDGKPTAEQIAEVTAALRGVEVLFAQANLPGEALRAASSLRWFQVTSAGVDRMAADGLLDAGFTVTKVSGLAAPAMAEWVIAAMLILTKNIHVSLRQQAERKWGFHWARELTGKTCGIVGLGAIGRETARRARAMGMEVVATRRSATPDATDPDCDRLFPQADLRALLACADFVVLCMPLTAESRGMIGRLELAAMKPTASLINVARGAVVDQEALIRALQDGTIASAALDVVEPEPLPEESPLWSLPNVMLTPHNSGAVEGYWARAAEMFIRNLERYVAGEPLEGLADGRLAY